MFEPLLTKTNGGFIASNKCRCGHLTSAFVAESDLLRYRAGAYIQSAFPYLSDDEREALFITGVCGTCWDAMFAEGW